MQQRADIGSEAETIEAIRATLNVLVDRLVGGQPRDILSELPIEILTLLDSQNMPEGARFGIDGFIQRVSEQEGASPAIAGQHMRAVLVTLREAVSRKELHDTLAQLPPEFTTLVEVSSGTPVNARKHRP